MFCSVCWNAVFSWADWSDDVGVTEATRAWLSWCRRQGPPRWNTQKIHGTVLWSACVVRDNTHRVQLYWSERDIAWNGYIVFLFMYLQFGHPWILPEFCQIESPRCNHWQSMNPWCIRTGKILRVPTFPAWQNCTIFQYFQKYYQVLRFSRSSGNPKFYTSISIGLCIGLAVEQCEHIISSTYDRLVVIKFFFPLKLSKRCSRR